MFNILGLGCLGRFGWRVFGVNAFQGLVLESVASRIWSRVCVCVCVLSRQALQVGGSSFGSPEFQGVST